MNDFFKRNKSRLLLFLAVLGPGLITAMADNDAGGVATYSVAASMFGMASQYFVVVTTVLLAVTQEIGARIAIVTGKGLGDLIRESYGARAAAVLFLGYFLVNQGVVLQNMSGLKASLQLLYGSNFSGTTVGISLVAVCVVMIALVILLNFKTLQKVFFTTIIFYATYLISAFLSHPNWGQALRESLVLPRQINLSNPSYWFTLIAVLGTTVTAWGQFFVNSYAADKGLKINQLKEERAEIYFSAIITNVFSWMIALAVTYTLFVNGIKVESGLVAAQAIEPFAGHAAYLLFAVGLLAASFLGLTIVPLATAYVFSELFGFERTLNASFVKGRVFYVFFSLQVVLALLVTLLPQINLFGLTLYADYLNGAVLPVIFFFLIRFSEDKQLMGEHASKGFSKYFLRIATGVIVLAVAASFVGKFILNLH